MAEETKGSFFIKNLIRGILWLAILIIAYVVLKNKVNLDYIHWLEPVYDTPVVVYLVYLFSEIVFGLIPPEIFMIWAVNIAGVSTYIMHVALLAVISYLAGYFGFWLGKNFNHTRFYRRIRVTYLREYEKYLNRYGFFLIIVAALTPIPFSGTSMLVGAVNYPTTSYLLFSLFRFLRYGLYAYFIYHADKI